MEKKRDIISLLLEIVCWLALLGGGFFFLLSFLPWSFLWVFSILAVLLVAFEIARWKVLDHKAVLRVVGLILMVLTIGTSVFCFQGAAEPFHDKYLQTEDLSRYERLRGHPVLDKIFGKDSNWEFIPYSIPDYASDVKFYHFPSVLQAHGEFSLEFTAPPEKVREWETLFEEKADYPGSYLDQGIGINQIADWLGVSHDCRVYVIYAEGQEGEENPPSLEHFQDWDHCKLYYGAVDPEENRVHFYRTYW